MTHPFTNIVPQPEGGPWTYVQLRDGFAAPQRFIAKGESVSLEVEVEADGTPHCRALEVRAQEGDVTSDTLRAVAVGKLTREAVAAAAVPVKAGKPVGSGALLHALLTTPPKEHAAFYERYTEGAREPRRGQPLTDENLSQVAALYRAALERGDPPTQTVADALHVPRSTAARWVAAARERKLLGPSLRGRAGERKEKR
jgi:hypothetical protein